MTENQNPANTSTQNGYRILPVRENHSCFGCGHSNKSGLKMVFFTDGSAVYSDLEIDLRFCGWKNIVHGGIVTTILDEIMGWTAIYLLKKITLTKSISVDFMKPIYADTQIRAEGRVIQSDHVKEALMEGRILSSSGDLLSQAKGKFSLISIENVSNRKIIDDIMSKEFEIFLSQLWN